MKLFWLLILFLAYPIVSYSNPVKNIEKKCSSIEIFSRAGCPHCSDAYYYLEQLKKEHPEIEIISRDVFANDENMRRFIEFNARFSIEQPGVPSFLLCDKYLIGFDNERTTGKHLEDLLYLETIQSLKAETKSVHLPILGEINVDNLGLPLFTIAIGLVDGFNPCAMWVLLILLSILINLKDRKHILLIAGTFVFISGAVYFLFMAAWLNLFLIIGFSKALQVIVGLAAILIGCVHIKDYLAFKQGVSLSIPDSVKPTIYNRIRNVIYAKNIITTFIAIVIMATLVNLIELLCTAGLPAVYTKILTLQQFNTTKYYLYLLLYNIAYMFDDLIMVGLVVFTLNKRKLKQSAGRWLKLLSGSIILVLGILLIFMPELLF